MSLLMVGMSVPNLWLLVYKQACNTYYIYILNRWEVVQMWLFLKTVQPY